VRKRFKTPQRRMEEERTCEQHNAPNPLTAERRAGATPIPRGACSSGIAVQRQWEESRACIQKNIIWSRLTKSFLRIKQVPAAIVCYPRKLSEFVRAVIYYFVCSNLYS
jgi:hypothetical protein